MRGSRKNTGSSASVGSAAPGAADPISVIRTLPELRILADQLNRSTVVACDLEADSMYHFKEKVCLIQLSADGCSCVVDPLAIGGVAPLRTLFADPGIRKVFHGADYDVRSLYRDFGIEIRNLFDTELACRFLGMRSTGLEPVLNKFFGVRLDKKYQKRDWSQRPLPDEMLRYAARDTVFLTDLAHRLIAQLKEKDRLTWVTEECELLSRVRPPEPNGGPLFLRFKGAGRMSRRNLAVLEGLLVLRQDLAAKRDKPLFKILGNDALLRVVGERPTDLKALRASKALSAKQTAMFGEPMVAAVRGAMEIPAADLPHYPRKRPTPLNAAVPRRIQALKSWRDDVARTLRLNPALLFTKSLLSAIAEVCPRRLEDLDRVADMRIWQKRTFGRDIVAQLKGVP
jgi:ribonuclease D